LRAALRMGCSRSAPYRTAVVLRDIEGLSTRDAAESPARRGGFQKSSAPGAAQIAPLSATRLSSPRQLTRLRPVPMLGRTRHDLHRGIGWLSIRHRAGPRDSREDRRDGCAADPASAGRATSLDDVMAATRSSKSQLYHYFGDKHGLVEPWSSTSRPRCSAFQVHALVSVDDWADLEGWADAMVTMVERRGSRGGAQLAPSRRGCRHRRDAPQPAERRLPSMARSDQRRAGKGFVTTTFWPAMPTSTRSPRSCCRR